MAEMSEIIGGLLEYGSLGIIIILLMYALIKKDKMVEALHDKILEKSEANTEKYYQLTQALNEALKELAGNDGWKGRKNDRIF